MANTAEQNTQASEATRVDQSFVPHKVPIPFNHIATRKIARETSDIGSNPKLVRRTVELSKLN